MITPYSSIQDYIKHNHPDEWRTGKWGCCAVGYQGTTLNSLKEEYPNGQLVILDTGTSYWVWFKE